LNNRRTEEDAKPKLAEPCGWAKSDRHDPAERVFRRTGFDFFFAPRFALWEGFYLPEVDRARDTLRQLDDPFATISNHNSRVNRWRLFFPLLGNLLHLRDWQFLLLPYAGCFCTLAYVALLCQRQRFTLPETLAASTLSAMGPWYFVSTGWLGYFDSWFLFSLLLACFSEKRWVIASACLIAPWIDERFVLALPVVLVVRMAWRSRFESEPRKQATQLMMIGVLTAVYPLLRLIALLTGNDPVTQIYASQHVAIIRSVPAATFLSGLWQGHRLLWVFAAVFLVHGFRAWRLRWAIASTVIVIATGLGSLVIAGDMHRSLEMLFPICLAGLLLSKPLFEKRFLPVLVTLTVLSAVLPASHRLWLENYPIGRLTNEIKRPRPPLGALIRAGRARATQLNSEGDNEGAVLIAGEMVALDESQADPLLFRAELYAGAGDFDNALADLSRARALSPEGPDVAFTAGVLAVQSGNRDAAIAAFEEAIRRGGPGWPGSGECRRAIAILSQNAGM
jgi:hypothetical protein